MADITSLKQEYSELMQKAKNIRKQIKSFNKKNPKVYIGMLDRKKFNSYLTNGGYNYNKTWNHIWFPYFEMSENNKGNKFLLQAYISDNNNININDNNLYGTLAYNQTPRNGESARIYFGQNKQIKYINYNFGWNYNLHAYTLYRPCINYKE